MTDNVTDLDGGSEKQRVKGALINTPMFDPS
jgi:hypothetical protein